MCDQTEVSYLPGDVVWVKLGPVWWPGVVANNEEIPPEITKNLRKTPIAIVKFFQEDAFEYVHKLSNIYHYNCLKKNDFIRKGLDIFRSKNRDAPSNMKLFPEDVARAEVVTGGNPDILHDEMFKPEEKPVISDLFPSIKKTPKRSKPEIKKKTPQSVEQISPRIITHPRFININTDYEVRERKQEPTRAECDEEDNSPPTTYYCPDCAFQTVRLNVIVLHNKSHTRNYAITTPSPKKPTKRKNISAVRAKVRPSETKKQEDEPIKEKISKTNGTVVQPPRKRGRPKKSVNTTPNVSTIKEKEPEPKKITCTPRRSTPQKDEFQESLLEDWAEFEEMGEMREDTDADTSNEETPRKSSSGLKENKEGSKSCFDFDDNEEQLVIDKTKIRAGRKIPRVLEKSEETKSEEKKEEIETNGTEEKSEQAETQNKIEEKHQQVEIEEEIEIETEEISIEETIETVQSPEAPTIPELPPEEPTKENEEEKEIVEFSQKVDQLLQEVSAPSKLPEIPRSLKKEHIKSYNASLTQKNNDEQTEEVIESISLINDDDSNDDLETKNSQPDERENIQVAPTQTPIAEYIENIDVTSDSSPEIVSVQLPTKDEPPAKKTKTSFAVPTRNINRTPIRFDTTPKYKTINTSQLSGRTVSKTGSKGQQPSTNLLRSIKLASGNNIICLPTTETVVRPALKNKIVMVRNLSKSTANPVKTIVQIPITNTKVTTQNPIANIDLTVPKVRITPQTKPTARAQQNIVQKSFKRVVPVVKGQQKNVILRPETMQMLIQTKPVTSVAVVSSSSGAAVPAVNQSEIISMPDEVVYIDNNEQTMEFIVDPAGTLISTSSTKKEDILAKALQDTDVLQTEMALSGSSTIVLDGCNIASSTGTTVYENVTLNTPPIMSSFETPSRTISANAISEIGNEMIIIEGENVQYME